MQLTGSGDGSRLSVLSGLSNGSRGCLSDGGRNISRVFGDSSRLSKSGGGCHGLGLKGSGARLDVNGDGLLDDAHKGSSAIDTLSILANAKDGVRTLLALKSVALGGVGTGGPLAGKASLGNVAGALRDGGEAGRSSDRAGRGRGRVLGGCDVVGRGGGNRGAFR